ncbi:MAG: helix-turn-helix domain-containing protein [Eubacteriales bacterium]
MDRTLYLIGKKGATDVSVREIAKEAGVNVAAINYHFRTKEMMLKEMENLFIDNYNQVYDVLDDKKLGAEEKIEKLLNEIIEYTIHYPGITILLNKKMADKKSEMGRYVDKSIKEKSKKIKALIKQITGNQDDEVAAFNEVVLLSSIVYPASDSQSISFYNDLNLSDKTSREKYVKHIIKIMKGRE